MTAFLVSLTIFILAHSLPGPTGLRIGLINRFGKKAYIIGYSILSTILLVWLIWSALNAPYIPLWDPNSATSLIPVILMLPACLLFACAILHPNPLSLSFVQSPIIKRHDITNLIRHPLLWALFLWAASHAIANGDLVGVIMFGGFAIFSLVGMKIMQRRAKRTLSAEEFHAAITKTSGQFTLRFKRVMGWAFTTELIFGALLYVALFHLHEPVIGVDPLALIMFW